MKKIVLSTMALLMMSGVAIAEENCSDKYVENQISKYGSITEKNLLSNISNQDAIIGVLTYSWEALIDKDYSNDCKGFYFAKKISNYGLSDAYNTVGSYYDFGKGVEKNWGKAEIWYKKSVNADDNLMALFSLASGYEEHGNIKKSIYWYKRVVSSQNLRKSLFQNFVNQAKKKIELYEGKR